jgi:hypothetical protein
MTIIQALFITLTLSTQAFGSELIKSAAQQGKRMQTLSPVSQPSPKPKNDEKSRPLDTGAYEISEEQKNSVKKSMEGISEISKSNQPNQKPLDLVR